MKAKFNNLFITGERFQQLADITILTEPIRQFHHTIPSLNINLAVMNGDMHNINAVDKHILEPIIHAQTIFVYTHLVEAFFREIVPHLTKPITLITHNSDHQIGKNFLPFIENPKILHWYGQNVALKHKKITALPIGLANSQWPHGQLELFDKTVQQKHSKTRLLYMNFDPRTNPDERLPIYNFFKNNPLVNVATGLSYSNYLEELATHFFAISPPGNGLDCHRIWECLYLGVIPIVMKNPGMEHFCDLPILLIDNWQQVDKKFLQNEFERLKKQLSQITQDRIDINYWAQQITEKNNTSPITFISKPTSSTTDMRNKTINYLKKIGMHETLKALTRIKSNGFLPTRILDIGAYVGNFSKAANVVFPEADILMIEPQPEAQSHLATLCRSNPERFDYVTALVGDKNLDSHSFWQIISPAGSTGSSIYPEQTDHTQKKLNLKMYRLDDLLKKLASKTFDFIKLDVQGAELDILKGGSETLAQAQVILLETSVLPYNYGAPLFAEIIEFMNYNKFILTDLFEEKRDAKNNLMQIDAVFFRTSCHHRPKLTITSQKNLPMPTSASVKTNLDSLYDRLKRLRNDETENLKTIPFWQQIKLELLIEAEKQNPNSFLRWPFITNTMHPQNNHIFATWFKELQNLPNWKTRWCKALDEDAVGNPIQFNKYEKTSPLLVQHAYHLSNFEAITNKYISDYDMIIEIGGGYGSMARLAYKSGFNGRYIIYDIPPVSILQELYLKDIGLSVTNNVQEWRQVICCHELSDLSNFRKIATPFSTLIIATFSLSEIALPLRDKIISATIDADAFILAYQHVFAELDNHTYFSQLSDRTSDEIDWNHTEIESFPKNYYLFGRKKS